MLLAHHQRIQLPRGGVQRIHRRINPQLRHLPRQHHRGIQVRESGRRRRVGQIVGRNINRLNRGDGALPRGGNPLLQPPHLLRQGRLVAHRRRHPPQQRRAFGPGQRVAVNVVHEQKDIAPLVAEIFRDGQPGQRHPQAVARRLVHLAIHQRHLVQNLGILHLVVEVVPLAGALAHPGENRVAGMLNRDVANQLHHVDGLPHARPAEKPHLAAFRERADQVDDLDAGLQNLLVGRQLLVAGRRTVDFPPRILADGAGLVDRIAQHVHDAPQRFLPHRNRDGLAGVGRRDSAPQPFGGAQRDGSHHPVAQLLLDFQNQAALVQGQRVVDPRHLVRRKLHINHRPDDLDDFSLGLLAHG